MFPLQKSELQIDNHSMISTFIYSIDNERLFKREEHRENKTLILIIYQMIMQLL